MKLAAWAHRHSRSIIFLFAVLAISGIVSSLFLPVALFPQVDFPRVRINLDAGERPAERMAIEVTYPTEEAIRAIPGVQSVRSTTSRGSAEISIDFGWREDMVRALLEVESQVNKTLPSLPAGTSFEAIRLDPTVFPTIGYSLTSDTHSLTELRDLAMFEIRPVLSRVPGVAKIDVQGGAVEEYRVVVDPAKLQSLSMSLSDVAASLAATNVLTTVGNLEDNDKLYLVITDTRFKDIAEVGSTVLRSGKNGVVTLNDVAVIQKQPAPQFTRVTADGHEAVLLQVFQQPGANTVQIAKGIRQVLDEESKRWPSGIRLGNWYDQSELIVASATSVRDAVLLGIALAAGVLLLFLRNWKITIIATLTVPCVLAVTVLLLYVLGKSFNIMTLGGMAAAVGLIIDDAIVMVEQIIRRLRGGSGRELDRVLNATDEFTRPLAGSSLSTIIIHIPPAFLIGVSGAFFGALSLSMATSLIVSFLVVWLMLPVLAARFLGPKDAHQEEGGEITGALQRGYAALMRTLLRWPWLILLFILGFSLVGYAAYKHVGTGFMPHMDEGGFTFDYKAPAGTSVTETGRLLSKVEAILQKTPEVQTYSCRTGLQLGGALTEPNTGDIFIRLKPQPRRDIQDVMADVRKEVTQTIPGLDVDLSQLMEDEIGDLTAVPQSIEIKIFSDDEKVLNDLATKTAEAIKNVPGVVKEEVQTGLVVAGDGLEIRVDRVKAALEGMDADAISKLVSDSLSGDVATQIQQGPKLIGVRVWIPKTTRKTIGDVEEMLIRAPDGHLFPLKRVASVDTVTGQLEIAREDLKRMVAVTARVEEQHYDLGSVATNVRKVLANPDVLPSGTNWRMGGLYAQQQIEFRGMAMVIIAASVLVFLLLLFLYESFRVATAIMLTTVLAIVFVFLGLWATGEELNLSSIMGMVMIVGNVTEVAIFYYSEFLILPHVDVHERLIAAGVNRMRAISMTTIAAILALLPLALAIGVGSAMQQPLAIAIIAGLIVQLPLVLIVLPALVTLLRVHGGSRLSG